MNKRDLVFLRSHIEREFHIISELVTMHNVRFIRTSLAWMHQFMQLGLQCKTKDELSNLHEWISHGATTGHKRITSHDKDRVLAILVNLLGDLVRYHDW